MGSRKLSVGLVVYYLQKIYCTTPTVNFTVWEWNDRSGLSGIPISLLWVLFLETQSKSKNCVLVHSHETFFSSRAMI